MLKFLLALFYETRPSSAIVTVGLCFFYHFITNKDTLVVFCEPSLKLEKECGIAKGGKCGMVMEIGTVTHFSTFSRPKTCGIDIEKNRSLFMKLHRPPSQPSN